LINKKGLLLCTGLLTMPGFASAADDLSYSFIEGDYINLSIDPYDEDGTLLEDFDDGNGWGARASYAFTESVFVFGGYSAIDSETFFADDGDVLFVSDRDIKRFDIGAGINMPMFESSSMQTDFVARAAYADVDFGDFDFGGRDGGGLDDLNEDSSDGFYVDALVRSQIASWLELSAGARYNDLESDDSFAFIGNALFEINPALGINLEVNAGEDNSLVMLGVRFSFGVN